MEEAKKYFETLKYEVAGWVIFARKKPPEWVNAVFVLGEALAEQKSQKHRTEKIDSKDIDLEDSWFMYCRNCGKTTWHKDPCPCGCGAVGTCTVCGRPNRHI